MFERQEPAPAKVFAAVLYRAIEHWEQALEAMSRTWGPVDCCSDPFPFTATDYYATEMGCGLSRRLVAFERLRDPAELSVLKLEANAIEAELSERERRTVNIDVGYLDFHKVVLASTKEGRHKVYVGRGIWADLTLLYEKGTFASLPWTFPDFRADTYHPFLLQVRRDYRHALRNRPASGEPR